MKTTALWLMGISLFFSAAEPGFADSMDAHKERLIVGKEETVSVIRTDCPSKIKIEKNKKLPERSSRPAREFRDR